MSKKTIGHQPRSSSSNPRHQQIFVQNEDEIVHQPKPLRSNPRHHRIFDQVKSKIVRQPGLLRSNPRHHQVFDQVGLDNRPIQQLARHSSVIQDLTMSPPVTTAANTVTTTSSTISSSANGSIPITSVAGAGTNGQIQGNIVSSAIILPFTQQALITEVQRQLQPLDGQVDRLRNALLDSQDAQHRQQRELNQLKTALEEQKQAFERYRQEIRQDFENLGQESRDDHQRLRDMLAQLQNQQPQHPHRQQSFQRRDEGLDGHDGRNNDANEPDYHTKRDINRKMDALPQIADNDEEAIQAFIRMLDELSNTLQSDGEERYMVAEIRYRLARLQNVPYQTLRGAQTWNDIKRILSAEINSNNSLNVLEARLANFEQKSGEALEEYGHRARKILRQFEAFYGDNLNAHFAQKINRDVTRQFSINARGAKIREALRLKSSDASLDETIQFAIEQETMLKSEDPDPEVICSYCGQQGHRLRFCYARDEDVARSNAISGGNSNKQCPRCDAFGHMAYQCQVRQMNSPNHNNNYNGHDDSDEHDESNDDNWYDSYQEDELESDDGFQDDQELNDNQIYEEEDFCAHCKKDNHHSRQCFFRPGRQTDTE